MQAEEKEIMEIEKPRSLRGEITWPGLVDYENLEFVSLKSFRKLGQGDILKIKDVFRKSIYDQYVKVIDKSIVDTKETWAHSTDFIHCKGCVYTYSSTQRIFESEKGKLKIYREVE